MPTINVERRELEKAVGTKLPDEILNNRLPMLGMQLEKIDKADLELEIFPNRPDMLSLQGLARALRSYLGIKPGLVKYQAKKSNYHIYIDKNVTMRPYTACAVVKNVRFTDERIRDIMQIQEKLAMTHGRNRRKSAYGLYPLNSINFPIRYVAKDPKTVMFQPLGSSKPIRADKVGEQHKTGKLYAHIAKDWKLHPFFIDSKENVLCMLPYTNSEDTGKIATQTRDVFIECTGNNLENLQQALTILSTMLADMGGTIHQVNLHYGNKKISTPSLQPRKKKISIERVNKILGLQLNEKEVKNLLERMGYGYNKGTALVPAYRADILHEDDITEDIAIAYGFDNLDPILPEFATVGKESDLEIFKRKVAEILAGLNMQEVLNYNIAPAETIKRSGFADNITVKDSRSEYTALRPSMLPGLLATLGSNKHYAYPQRLFEIGSVFSQGTSETGVVEPAHLGIIICQQDADFTKIKQIAQNLMQQLGLEGACKAASHPSLIPGRTAQLTAQGKPVGTLGEVHPEFLSNFKIETPAAYLEVDVVALFNLARNA